MNLLYKLYYKLSNLSKSLAINSSASMTANRFAWENCSRTDDFYHTGKTLFLLFINPNCQIEGHVHISKLIVSPCATTMTIAKVSIRNESEFNLESKQKQNPTSHKNQSNGVLKQKKTKKNKIKLFTALGLMNLISYSPSQFSHGC